MAEIREDGAEQIEVHVAGACVRQYEGRWQLLAGQRTDFRSLFPGKWECGGGQVRKGEDFPAAVRRQIFEEFGLDVSPLQVIETYSIHVPGQRIIPGVRFLCLANAGTVRLCGREFSRFEWLDLPPSPDKDWIPGLKEMLDRITPDYLDELLRPVTKPVSGSKQSPGFVQFKAG